MVKGVQDDFIDVMHGTAVGLAADMNIQVAQVKCIPRVFSNKLMHAVGDWVTYRNTAFHVFA